MNDIIISLDIPKDIYIAINESEQELKSHFHLSLALMLFKEGKLTIGKAVQLSKLDRHSFEKELIKNNIPIVNTSIDQVMSDVEKLKEL